MSEINPKPVEASTENKQSAPSRVLGWFKEDLPVRGGLVALALYLVGGDLLPDRGTLVDSVQSHVCVGYVDASYAPTQRDEAPRRADVPADPPPRTTPRDTLGDGGLGGNAREIRGSGDDAPSQRLPD